MESDCSSVVAEELHVLAVDDCLVDRKFIERLLKISSCKVLLWKVGGGLCSIWDWMERKALLDLMYSITIAFSIAFVLTFSSIFDVPVFWPILFFYWIILCMLTLRRQILHMIKYKYVPFSVRKQRYNRKSAPTADNERLPS